MIDVFPVMFERSKRGKEGRGSLGRSATLLHDSMDSKLSVDELRTLGVPSATPQSGAKDSQRDHP